MVKTSAEAVVELEDVEKAYEFGGLSVKIMRGVNLSVEPGEFICLFGSAGSGKTSLLNMIACISLPSSGRISICGEDLIENPEVREGLRKTRVALLSRVSGLIPDMTAHENIDMALGMTASGQFKTTDQIFEEVGLKGKENERVANLSPIDSIKLTIGKSLANEPDLLVCDDLTGDFEEEESMQVIEILRRQAEAGKTAIVLSTSEVSIEGMADRSFKMENGKLITFQRETE